MDIGTIGCVVIGLGGLAVGAVAVWRQALVMEHMARTHRAMSEAMAKLAQSRPFHIFERTTGGEVTGLANDERGQYPVPTTTTVHQRGGKGIPVAPPPMDLLDPEAADEDYVTVSERR
jgi:hypothetical protein